MRIALIALAALSLAACKVEPQACPSDSYCTEQRAVYTFKGGEQLLQDGENWYQLMDFTDGSTDWYAVTAPDEAFMADVVSFEQQEVLIDGFDGAPHTREAVNKRIAQADAEALAYEETYSYEEF